MAATAPAPGSVVVCITVRAGVVEVSPPMMVEDRLRVCLSLQEYYAGGFRHSAAHLYPCAPEACGGPSHLFPGSPSIIYALESDVPAATGVVLSAYRKNCQRGLSEARDVVARLSRYELSAMNYEVPA